MLWPLLLTPLVHADPVQGYVDLHIHLAAHLAVPVYGEGPEATPPAAFTNHHALRPQIFVDDLGGALSVGGSAGPRILVSLAYAHPFRTVFESQASMRARIERQLDYVDAFCTRHADRFGRAGSPEEAREIIASGRVAVVHGIEGATKILGEPGDAERWAARGIAVVTPIHLADNELGGALCQSGGLVLLNVSGCIGQALAPRRQGLTVEGRASVAALMDAGVVIDLAHASPPAFSDLLGMLGARGVGPVYTHATAYAVREDRGALTDSQIEGIYALGGLVGITSNLRSVAPKPVPPALSAGRCPGSIDDLRLHWDHLVAYASGGPVGWGSDFQGGIAHLRPQYGPRGCEDSRPDGAPLDAFDVEGLSRPGLVGAMFDHLTRDGADRAPLDGSAERFLEIWSRARGAAGRSTGAP